MKMLRTSLFLAMIAAVLILLLILGKGLIPFPWEAERETLVYTSLVESCESSLLQTAEYSMKMIFPYDFVDPEDLVDWAYLKRQYDYLPDEFALRASEEFYHDRELPEKWKYAGLYSLCRECGIDPAGRGEGFIVVSSRTRAGFDFSETSIVLENPEVNEKKMDLILPGPEITAIIIDDRIPEDKGYPDMVMTPDQWSRFITALTPEIGAFAVKEGILELAEETAGFLLRDLFEGAGLEIRRIEFQYESP
ncbi:MAG: DUF4230 domain-containing protein [Spirochaetales bacterium]|nr:DUF4230 domain-containing protein [Spirochaetales bacterium]